MNFAMPATPPMALPAATSIPGTGIAPAAGTAQHRKLVEAAQQFEGMLMQEMLKPMREHGFGQQDSDDKEEGSGFADTLSSFGTETMATAIAKSGGLGIAKRVVAQVEAENTAHGSTPANAAPAKKSGL
jgi:Rod binding domain-containing protein